MPTRPATFKPTHARTAKRVEKPRESASKRGYGRRWQATAKGWLRHHPLCVECKKTGRDVEATEVDHIVPHRGDMKLFWERSNWQSLCKRCHSAKTARGL